MIVELGQRRVRGKTLGWLPNPLPPPPGASYTRSTHSTCRHCRSAGSLGGSIPSQLLDSGFRTLIETITGGHCTWEDGIVWTETGQEWENTTASMLLYTPSRPRYHLTASLLLHYIHTSSLHLYYFTIIIYHK